jgi:large conductance mechanosensitive channel
MEGKKVKKKASKLKKEFKNFAFKEATLGAAIGIMLGGAFRDVINSLVEDILTPPIGYITSGLDFSDLYLTLGGNSFETLEDTRKAGIVVIHYGNFISEFTTFLITAFILFLISYQGAKIINKMNKKEESKKEEKTLCPYCKTKIHPKATRCPYCTSQL